MTGAVALLAASPPRWLLFPKLSGGRLLGFASPTGTIWSKGPLDLAITRSGEGAVVKEIRPDRLPAWCPELHLNADATFCLALEKIAIRSPVDAAQWWADLEVHLRLLSVALRTRVWPSHSALDHGEAGAFHRRALRLAERLGLADEYAAAQAGDPSWIRDQGCELIGADGAILAADGRCPCGVSAFHRLSSCSRRHGVRLLVLLERARRLSLAGFWTVVRGHGRTCCGRMRDCPLAAPPVAEVHGRELLRRTKAALRRTPDI